MPNTPKRHIAQLQNDFYLLTAEEAARALVLLCDATAAGYTKAMAEYFQEAIEKAKAE